MLKKTMLTLWVGIGLLCTVNTSNCLTLHTSKVDRCVASITKAVKANAFAGLLSIFVTTLSMAPHITKKELPFTTLFALLSSIGSTLLMGNKIELSNATRGLLGICCILEGTPRYAPDHTPFVSALSFFIGTHIDSFFRQ